MNIHIICIGKLKEDYWTNAIKEYSKRLSKYCTLLISELKEEKSPDNPSQAEELAIKEAEGRRILKQIKKDSYVIALEIQGKQLTSEELSEKIQELGVSGKSDISFIIGGSIGLSQEVLSRADFRLSFSKMTFPHQMMRVVLLEQIYRSFKIIKKESYHK
ncbi:23S rRNA (pseudouridine(1915)-N(3))-methyltransferase RlmH [Sinanaerobacter chloroacetimidivorans]|jgi:23S rRNA (pseudouridine1915-N3)-methyltransferase|uniref:Ribosomal RNA large subunit methyltransferase H n=1 Tax=Sinanaerobacter chloroacetimidivorans TaxID=2818044 RepID=A0A8J7W1W4_9FIRM|nr:23S rRNA (pseudouridine(1915)-N(3))-methyltransferase RlmH [Sinanaerobacter chloroacetimidivorans]MBR0597705.1 23S rRNA (pseudouridine(1915)-N(3))-methyltransferase RlmH [Sinanaerobacter chloroacetimidivorans]